MASRLPIAVAPADHETAASYVTRLATLHGMPFAELWPQVSRPRADGGASRSSAPTCSPPSPAGPKRC
jgi:hypothetical protein